MSVVLVDEVTLGAVMPGIVLLLPPLLAQFDLMLTGQFGLGALLADITLQLNAAISVQVDISVQISNPFAALQAQLQAVLMVQASIEASLSLGLPSISASFSASLSANLAISAELGLQIGGIQLLIKAGLAIKIPIIDLLASLSVGPVDILTIGFSGADTLASSGAEYAALAATGVGTLLPTDQVFGVIILTKVPAASVAMQAVFLT
jgi:hypothetical protein